MTNGFVMLIIVSPYILEQKQLIKFKDESILFEIKNEHVTPTFFVLEALNLLIQTVWDVINRTFNKLFLRILIGLN